MQTKLLVFAFAAAGAIEHRMKGCTQNRLFVFAAAGAIEHRIQTKLSFCFRRGWRDRAQDADKSVVLLLQQLVR